MGIKTKNVNLYLCFVILLVLIKFDTVYSQPVSFSLNSSANLNLVYQTENDFETERLVTNAFRMELRGRNIDMMVSAKAISTLNFSFTRLPEDAFSIKLNNTNFFVNSSYNSKFAIDFSDKNILYFRANNSRTYYFDYNLYYKPVGYEVEPGQYYYSIIFTVTEI